MSSLIAHVGTPMIMYFVFYRILFFLELKITSLLSVVSYLPGNNSSSNSKKNTLPSLNMAIHIS